MNWGKMLKVARDTMAFAIVIVLLADVAIAADAGKEKAAVAAAERWLALVDDGKYADSWRETAEMFRHNVDQKSWEQRLRSDREPVGKCVVRTVATSTFRKSPPGSAGRERIEIRFNTSFENGKYALERLTLVFDKDGQWRVTGYLITARLPALRDTLMALLLFVVIITVWFVELKGRRDILQRRSV